LFVIVVAQDKEENAGKYKKQDDPDPLAALSHDRFGSVAGRGAGQLVIWRYGRFLFHLF
jgi:hypothetical protein